MNKIHTLQKKELSQTKEAQLFNERHITIRAIFLSLFLNRSSEYGTHMHVCLLHNYVKESYSLRRPGYLSLEQPTRKQNDV